MKQASLKLNLNVKKTRKQVFLEQMEKVVPWAALVELIAPYYPEGKTGRPPFSLQSVHNLWNQPRSSLKSDNSARCAPSRVVIRCTSVGTKGACGLEASA